MNLDQALSSCPIVAILRGITPQEAPAIGDALLSAGITVMEVPLNSPQPLDSIRCLADLATERALVGAGTVLNARAVDEVVHAGGQLIVAPNLNWDVGKAAQSAQVAWAPGILSPTEAFAALEAGADSLKIFPAEMAPPRMVKAMRAVLPVDAKLIVVGGIDADNMAAYTDAGANGFGIGSSLYRPGVNAEEIFDLATRLVKAVRAGTAS